MSVDGTTMQVLTVIFVATLIRSAFGFGEALVAVPPDRPMGLMVNGNEITRALDFQATGDSTESRRGNHSPRPASA